MKSNLRWLASVELICGSVGRSDPQDGDVASFRDALRKQRLKLRFDAELDELVVQRTAADAQEPRCMAPVVSAALERLDR